MTQDEVKNLFEYHDGHLYWREAKGTRGLKGSRTGSLNSDGYIQTKINKTAHRNHRLVFLYHHGYLPEFIDHIDNDRANNRIENLREATKGQNAMNRKIQDGNTSGFKGVSWVKKLQKWRVQIHINGKKKHVGVFQDIELADLVAQEARDLYYGQYARSK